MCINLNIDVTPTASRSHTHPSHSLGSQNALGNRNQKKWRSLKGLVEWYKIFSKTVFFENIPIISISDIEQSTFRFHDFEKKNYFLFSEVCDLGSDLMLGQHILLFKSSVLLDLLHVISPSFLVSTPQ